MLIRLAVACFALYCVHGAQNTARDADALAKSGASMVREASAQAPRAALGFCLENQTLCAKALSVGEKSAQTSAVHPKHALGAHALAARDYAPADFPLPPRRPVSFKKA